MNTVYANGYTPSSFSITRVQKIPGGVPFSALHAMVQLWHPTQRFRSTATPHFTLRLATEFTLSAIVTPSFTSCIHLRTDRAQCRSKLAKARHRIDRLQCRFTIDACIPVPKRDLIAHSVIQITQEPALNRHSHGGFKSRAAWKTINKHAK